MQRNHQGLRLAAKAIDQESGQQTASATDEMQPLTQPPSPPQQPIPQPQPTTERSVQVSPAQQRRLARYQEVIALAAEGLGPKAIAQRVGLTRQTVAIWLRVGSFPERPPSAPRRMLITPYEPYLGERWQAGEQNSRQFWREIQAQGFRGGSETVRRLTVRWRTECGHSSPPPKCQASKPTPRRAPPTPATRPLSPRQARWLLLKPEAELKPEQRLYLEHLGRSYPEVLAAQQLILAFLQLVRKRDAASLELWIATAQASGLPELVEFVKGLLRDRAAVEGALRYEWSNGITEGRESPENDQTDGVWACELQVTPPECLGPSMTTMT